MTTIDLDILPKTVWSADRIGQIMAVRAEVEDSAFDLNEDGVNIKIYHWNDGSGNGSALYISEETNEAMFLIYSHESPLNAYAFGETVGDTNLKPYDFQKAMYVGLPKYFIDAVSNKEESYTLLNIVNENTHERILSSTGVLYFDGDKWAPTDFYNQMIGFGENGGFNYVVNSSWMNIQTFAVQAKEYKKYWADENDPVIAKLEELDF